MKVSETTQFYLHYQKANSKGNSLKNYKYVLCKYNDSFGEREIDTITALLFPHLLSLLFPKRLGP